MASQELAKQPDKEASESPVASIGRGWRWHPVPWQLEKAIYQNDLEVIHISYIIYYIIKYEYITAINSFSKYKAVK